MRTKSIISIIRRYGLSSKRLNPKNKIKYEDAIKGLEGYENAELKIVDVIDNKLFPNKSVSCKCQIPGCNHRIRYEYVLENKKSHERIVAGSTCVWPTLGLSEIEKKEFLTFERVVKEHHDLLEWAKENQDVVDKLKRMKREGLIQYRPFWTEIINCRLLDEDTNYIRSIDVDKVIEKRNASLRAAEEYRKKYREQREKLAEDYKRVLDGLEMLVKEYPYDGFYKSLSDQVSCGRRLTASQTRSIKVACNKHWYNTHIKGKDIDLWNSCEDIVRPILKGRYPSSDEVVEIVNREVRELPRNVKLAWNIYKVKYQIVL